MYDVAVVIAPENPLRCVCPECGKTYETPPAIALRILWEVMLATAERSHCFTAASQAIGRIQGAQASKEQR